MELTIDNINGRAMEEMNILAVCIPPLLASLLYPWYNTLFYGRNRMAEKNRIDKHALFSEGVLYY